ncbi:MAG: flagellar basal body P-ring formation protein FlgA [Polaromonas sp.]|nr:flagellar basal body P-ring formation protein FlgA [Polaromonas sp.]
MPSFKIFRLSLVTVLAWLALGSVSAAPAGMAGSSEPRPLSDRARAVIEQFLHQQTAGLPGKTVLSIEAPKSGDLPPCEVMEAFLPSGVRPWGRFSVGIRCTTGRLWTRYVPASISVISSYYAAARLIKAGEAITAVDVEAREGDLTSLPASVVVDFAQVSGAIALNQIASGAPLRRELLRAAAIVQQGQVIKMITQGPGFMVSTEGKAMTNAAVGAVVQVRLMGGQLVSGTVRTDGMVERSN